MPTHPKDAEKAMARDNRGRFLSRFCPDPNCSGTLVYEADRYGGWWVCDGLTHERGDDPLVACNFSVEAALAKPESTNE